MCGEATDVELAGPRSRVGVSWVRADGRVRDIGGTVLWVRVSGFFGTSASVTPTGNDKLLPRISTPGNYALY